MSDYDDYLGEEEESVARKALKALRKDLRRARKELKAERERYAETVQEWRKANAQLDMQRLLSERFAPIRAAEGRVLVSAVQALHKGEPLPDALRDAAAAYFATVSAQAKAGPQGNT